jgi:hypothetical protein
MQKKPQIRAYRQMNIEAAEQCKQESKACTASMTHGLSMTEGGGRGCAPLPPWHECPLLASGVLLSHGLSPQYHRRSGA